MAIYSDQILEVLYQLALKADSTYGGKWLDIENLMDLDVDERKRACGKKGGNGFPKRRPYDPSKKKSRLAVGC